MAACLGVAGAMNGGVAACLGVAGLHIFCGRPGSRSGEREGRGGGGGWAGLWWVRYDDEHLSVGCTVVWFCCSCAVLRLRRGLLQVLPGWPGPTSKP